MCFDPNNSLDFIIKKEGFQNYFLIIKLRYPEKFLLGLGDNVSINDCIEIINIWLKENNYETIQEQKKKTFFNSKNSNWKI